MYNKIIDLKLKLQIGVDITIKDDFDDILGDAGLWITQERLLYGLENLPTYDWDNFDLIKKRHSIIDMNPKLFEGEYKNGFYM